MMVCQVADAGCGIVGGGESGFITAFRSISTLGTYLFLVMAIDCVKFA